MCWSEGDAIGKKCNVADDVVMLGSEQLWIPVRAAYEYICQVHYQFRDFRPKGRTGSSAKCHSAGSQSNGLVLKSSCCHDALES